jgi:hypothetical protein
VKLILSGFNAVAHRGQAAVDAIISSALLDTNENAIRQRKIKAGQEKAWKNKYRSTGICIFYFNLTFS